jgi:Ser/Thr protein kinase RdoA (MazF antagonist)
MSSYANLDTNAQVDLLTAHAGEVLKHYELGEISEIESINHEYNSTFSVKCLDGSRYALRININSQRSKTNALAELEFINHLKANTDLNFASPTANKSGDFFTEVANDAIGKTLLSVLFSWLEGEELGDEPTDEQLFALGAAMAKMHDSAAGFELSAGAELPNLRDVLWLTEDLLTTDLSQLSSEDQVLVRAALDQIDGVVDSLFARDSARVIHADMHGWNLMWHDGALSVFDFDDCGVGLPIQDLYTALYYLDTAEQDAALKAGYASVREIPQHSEFEAKALLLQRRIILLNYLFETSTPEHREILPKYTVETMRRINEFLEKS